MKFRCPHEIEVAAALNSGRWPHQIDVEVRDHVQRCPICRDLVLVAQELRADRRSAIAEARVPAAGALWWRAQLQRQYTAADHAVRPIAWVEHVALFSAILSAFGIAVWQLGRVSTWFHWLSGVLHAQAFHLKTAAEVVSDSTPVFFLSAALALLAATVLAIYVGSHDT